MTDKHIILEGIVGSTAYGLAREGSDEDRLGIWLEPTANVVGLGWNWNKASVVQNNPDKTIHELHKFLHLCLKGNPTVMELLWLPDYTKMTWVGQRLIDIRHRFLSTDMVRNAYMGYARQQAHKLKERGGTFDSDTKNRTAKHARHCLRLTRQGARLLATGELMIKVDDPEEYWAFDDLHWEEMYKRLMEELEELENAESVLPAAPDYAFVNAWLTNIRKNNW